MKALGGLLKQAQKMQEEMQQTQARLAAEEGIGEAGGGMVRGLARLVAAWCG